MLHSVTYSPIRFLIKLELGCTCIECSHAECADCRPIMSITCARLPICRLFFASC